MIDDNNYAKFWMNKLVERRHVNPEVAGSNPALVNLYLFIQNVSKNVPSQFPLWFITWE